jgi:hypothetical protein
MLALMTGACSREAPPDDGVRASAAGAGVESSEAASRERELAVAIRTALGGDWDVRYFDAAVDLNGDGRQESVVMVAGPMVCGTGGCPVMVFTPAPAGYRLVTQVSVAQPPVRVSPRISHGWRSLVVGVHGGGIMQAYGAELPFDGSSYPSNATVPPAVPAAGLEGVEVLIPEFGSYTDGKPLPAAPAN